MFKAPFSFEGRIRRTEYGLSMIIYYFLLFTCIILLKIDEYLILLVMPIYIGLIWFVIAQSAKRCHDRGNSGWWQLIPLYAFLLLFLEGDLRRNEYGESPKVKNQYVGE